MDLLWSRVGYLQQRKERSMSNILLDAKGITKIFPGVKALDNVDLQIAKGEVHGLIGENGAGKSTIIKILAGVHTPDGGEITFCGESYAKDDINQSLSRGISVIYQELCLVPHMTVYENIMLGFEPTKGMKYNANDSRKAAQKILDDLQLELPLDAEVASLDIAVQQMVEIAKGFSRNSKLIIMDEPTSSLTNKEVDKLFSIIRNLKERGISTLFVSHKLDEISEICDRITVFRDGHSIISCGTHDISRDEMVYHMVGRKVENYYVNTHTPSDEVVLKVNNLTKEGVISDVSFELHKGEVLGFTGLIGAGRTETMQMLFGLDTPDSGEIIYKGEKVKFANPYSAIDAGIALVPENRKEQGIVPLKGVDYNITISSLKEIIKNVGINRKVENEMVENGIRSLRVKASSPEQLVGNLSGGNQQKVILARWLATDPTVLIMDEPTRGIDVGAKAEIYGIIDELAKKGVAVIVISSELPEVINISDRIVVMSNHKITGILSDKKDFDQEIIMNYCLGGNK